MSSRYEGLLNLYRGGRAFSRMCLANMRKEYIPWYLFIIVTEKCNLNCRYCFVDVPNRRKDKNRLVQEWTTEKVFKIIDDFYAAGTRYLSFCGGEPLLREDLEELIDYANKKGMLTDIFTNGVFIHKKINALKKLSRVTISLEGNENEHDRDRGIGTYRQIVENMKLLNKSNIRFSINCTVTSNNADINSVKHILGLAKKYNSVVGVGEAAIKFDPNLEDNLASKEQLRRFWQEMRCLKLQGYPLQKTLKSIDFCIETLDFVTGKDVYEEGDYVPYSKKIFPCAYGRYCAYLDTDGTLYPCANLFNKLGKNIFEVGIKEAWNYLNTQLKCYICRDSITGGTNYFFAMDFNTIKEAAKHFFNIYVKPFKQSTQ